MLILCLEAFSDGVITTMVLALKVPHGADFNVLLPLAGIHGLRAQLRVCRNLLEQAPICELPDLHELCF
jgi:hypothetical protein